MVNRGLWKSCNHIPNRKDHRKEFTSVFSAAGFENMKSSWQKQTGGETWGLGRRGTKRYISCSINRRCGKQNPLHLWLLLVLSSFTCLHMGRGKIILQHLHSFFLEAFGTLFFPTHLIPVTKISEVRGVCDLSLVPAGLLSTSAPQSVAQEGKFGFLCCRYAYTFGVAGPSMGHFCRAPHPPSLPHQEKCLWCRTRHLEKVDGQGQP